MQKIKPLFVFLIPLFLFSCAVTKRQYLPGYYVQRHNSSSVSVATQPGFPVKTETESINELTSANETSSLIAAPDSGKTISPHDTIITKKNFFNNRSDTIICEITNITFNKVFYTKKGVASSIAKKKVQHSNVTVNKPGDHVERIARRSMILGWIALICIFPGGLLFLIPWLIGIPCTIFAYTNSKKALEEINKNPGNYSSKTKKQARFGKIASKIIEIFFITYLIAGFILLVVLAILIISGTG